MIRERSYDGLPGLPVFFGLLLADAALIWMFVINMIGAERNGGAEHVPEIIFALVMFVVVTSLMLGLFMVNPNEAKVLQLFGAYKGTAKVQGLRWANPFLRKRKVSLRV